MSYNSKYEGEEVERLLDSIGNKVDKVEGKQLSTEDFTTLLKQKLDGLSNYDDTEISQAVSKLRTDLDTLVSGDTTTAIKTFNEVIAFLDGISDTEDLSGIIASIEQQIAAKQETLVSGSNIKTINGESILGSGNIVIEGGGSSSGSGTYAEVNHGTSDTTFTLTPNTFHVWDEVASLDLSFADEQAGVANEYLFQFTSGATATTLTLPDVKWANDSTPTIEANTVYQISILKGLASTLKYSKSIFPITLVYSNTLGNSVYAGVFEELIKRGVPGSLESGLLYVDYNDNIVEVTNYSFWLDNTNRILLYSFGSPIYQDIILWRDGTIQAFYND